MRYLIGVDLGTSGTKTVIFDTEGRALASHTVEYPLYQEKNGYAEQDPNDWYQAAIKGIKEVLHQSKVSSSDVAGLAIAGQMHGLVMLDKDGNVLRRSILWCDARTGKQCDEITRRVGKNRLIEINANPALPGFTAPKILWVREHEKEIYDKCATILLPKDYVRYRLTGKLAMEISDASGTNLLDIKKRQWSDEILKALDIDPALLPPIIESSEVAGYINDETSRLTGLEQGVIVAGGAGDNAAAALGTGVCEDGQSFVTLGTSGVVFAHTSQPAIDPLGRVHTFCAAVPNSWTAMSCTLAAGLSLRWTRDVLWAHEKEECDKKGEEVYNQMTSEAETVPAGSDGLIYLPYLMGERSPVLDPDARGVFFGLSGRHQKAHLTRAVLEGITLSQKHNLQVLHEMGIKPEILTACGGGGASPMWRQLIADVLDTKVNTIASKEGPALGAAVLAAAACGIFKSVPEGCRAMVVKGSQVVEPRADEVKRYEQIYDLYAFLYPLMRPAFAKLAALRQVLDGDISVKEGKVKSVYSVEFERYGKVIEGVDCQKVAEILKTLPRPSDAVTYVPSEPKLETQDLMADLQNRVFGGLPVQIGYCSGHNRVLNCLEYHRNSELNVTGTDVIFMLAPMSAIKDGIIDTQCVEYFHAPANTAVLLYETSLHYAPCTVDGAEGFSVAVVLPRGTNTDKPQGLETRGEAGYLTNNNKWLYAHKDSPEGTAGITGGVLIGQNHSLDD